MATNIEAPVSAIAVAQFLGLPAQYGGCDVGYLCSNIHGRIKMWSSNKPMRHPSLLPLTSQQKREANHGLIAPAFATAALPADLSWRQQTWSYGAPRGEAYNEPYRLSDFDGYETIGEAIVETPGSLSVGPLDTGSMLRFLFGSTISIIGTNNLSLNDFAYLADYYPCVVLYFRDKDGTQYMRCKTGSLKFGTAGMYSVDIPVSQILSLGAEGDIDYFMCGCDVQQLSLGVPLSSSYVVLPCDAPLYDRIIVTDTLPLRLWFDTMTGGIRSGAGFYHGTPVADYNPMGQVIPRPDDDELTPGAPSGTNYKYFNVGNRATLTISITFTNMGSSSIKIPRTSLFCRVANNLAGATSPAANPAALQRFTGTGSYAEPVDAIRLSAGASDRYLVSWPEYSCVRRANGGIESVPSGTKRFNAGFHLYYGSGSQRVALGSIGINIQK